MERGGDSARTWSGSLLVRLQRGGLKGPSALHNDQLGVSHVQFQFQVGVLEGGFAHTKRVSRRARASAPTAAATSCLPSGNEESATLTAQPCIEELLVQGQSLRRHYSCE